MSEQCGHEVALEKRLNEIRRLETINDDLLAALESLESFDWPNLSSAGKE